MAEYDFTHTINTAQLLDEIAVASLPMPGRIDTVTDAVQIFYENALDAGQESSLTSVVSAHLANPFYVSPAAQAQIDTLLSYLNNPNMAIANTARAAIVANIAPRLAPGLVTLINAQIYAALNPS